MSLRPIESDSERMEAEPSSDSVFPVGDLLPAPAIRTASPLSTAASGQLLSDLPQTATGTFGFREPLQGILASSLGFDWPFRIYIRKGGVDPHDNAMLQAQLAATPMLDPKPFGSRPAASPNLDRRLKSSDIVFTLNTTRLGYLEEQRSLTAKATDPTLAAVERDEAKEGLVAKISQEIDYAATRQGAPNMDEIIGPIQIRGVGDPTWMEAVRSARTAKENEWRVDDRVLEGTGALQRLGEDGRYDTVTATVKQRLIGLADTTQADLGDKTSPEAISAAMLKRAGVYSTYTGGDAQAYLSAVRAGVSAAHEEIFLERPVRNLQLAWGQGGLEGAKAFTQELAGLDPDRTLPGVAGRIMSDPRVQGIISRSVDVVAAIPSSGDQREGVAVIQNLARVSQNAIYGDASILGEGKQSVDLLAETIVGKAIGSSNLLSPVLLPQLLADDEGGNAALALAIAGKAGELGNAESARLRQQGQPGRNAYLDLRDGAIWAARKAIENFGDAEVTHAKKMSDDAAFITVPMETWGAGLTDEEKAAQVDRLLAASPELAQTLEGDGQQLTRLRERRESIDLAVNLYTGALRGTEGFDLDAVSGNAPPGVPTDPTRVMSVLEAVNVLPKLEASAGAPITKAPNSLWLERSSRLFATFAMTESLRRAMPDSTFRNVLAGAPESATVRGLNVNVLSRASGGLSSFLFAKSAAFLSESPDWIDQLYVPLHASVALSQAANMALPSDWKAAIFGTVAESGHAATPVYQLYTAAATRIDRLGVGASLKGWLKHIAAGALKDTADFFYTFADGINAAVYFSRGDVARGIALSISALGDLAFLAAGPGFQLALETSAPVVGNGGTLRGPLGFLARRGAVIWTGVGAVLMMLASTINYGKGLHDEAHRYDGTDTRWLEAMGARGGVAESVAKHMMIAGPDQRSAGPVLMAAFWKLGYTPTDIGLVLNTWTPDQADRFATFIKSYDTHPAENITQAALDWASENGIPMPRYAPAEVEQFKAHGVREDRAVHLGTTQWPAPDASRVTAGAMLEESFSYLGYTEEERAQVMNSWSIDQVENVARFTKSYRKTPGSTPANSFLGWARKNGLPLLRR
ncbi:hypothetical protein [Inquilinus sp. OTU3971]|uniref:hypothetical protein n=1 Tax=Inquilinus sp. OTU3971 TaxID=3043855 RepID=UPI00313A9C7C